MSRTMFEDVYIQHFSYWKPPADSLKDAPKLPYVDPLFKRRLSQLSRMTIEVVHGVLAASPEAAQGAKLVFASYRGEITRQLKINRGLVEDGAVLPAQFSLSTFNTPPAVATIALGMKAGYTAVYPAQRQDGTPFYDALACACAPLRAGTASRVLFVYGDELVPSEYAAIATDAEKAFAPFAFAALLGTERTAGAFPLPAALTADGARGAACDASSAGKAQTGDTQPAAAPIADTASQATAATDAKSASTASTAAESATGDTQPSSAPAADTALQAAAVAEAQSAFARTETHASAERALQAQAGDAQPLSASAADTALQAAAVAEAHSARAAYTAEAFLAYLEAHTPTAAASGDANA